MFAESLQWLGVKRDKITFMYVVMRCHDNPYRPRPPSGRAQTALRPRCCRTRWPNTLWTGTLLRPVNRKRGNAGSKVWPRCWSAATLQCLLCTVGESEGEEGGGVRGDSATSSSEQHKQTETSCFLQHPGSI